MKLKEWQLLKLQAYNKGLTTAERSAARRRLRKEKVDGTVWIVLFPYGTGCPSINDAPLQMTAIDNITLDEAERRFKNSITLLPAPDESDILAFRTEEAALAWVSAGIVEGFKESQVFEADPEFAHRCRYNGTSGKGWRRVGQVKQ